jgi:Lrp/AsnC family leucine-responsive transcriptional regulator
MLDTVDFKVLSCLMRQGRMTWSELAGQLGLSSPATAERVRRLEEKGVISGYAAHVNPEAVGCVLMAFVSVTLEHPQHRAAFLAKVQALPEVQECHHVTGDGDYLLKIRCRGTADLERVISEELKGVPGVLKTHTSIVLSSLKETSDLPLSV